MLYIGIDPGKTGGISSLLNDDSDSAVVDFMPSTEKEIFNLFENYKIGSEENLKVIIEQQHAFPGMAAKAQWTFAEHYGFLRGVLVSLRIPFTEVSPQKWMAHFGFKRLPKEEKKEHKKRIYQKAQNLFPNSSVALQTADSLMLAEYLRLTNK